MTTTVSLRAGHDVCYFTVGHGAGSCAGAMAYYTKSGEPPGQWTGRGAAKLDLTGKVDPDVIQNLYKNIGPGGRSARQAAQAGRRDHGHRGGLGGARR